MENSVKTPVYQKKNRTYFFLRPFKQFSSVFKKASFGHKASMSLNFVLPGSGNILLGAIEVGLAQLLAFLLLLAGTIYFGCVIGNGTVKTSGLTNVVVFGLLAFGLLSAYYSSFASNVSNNYKLNGGNEIKTFLI